MAGELLLDSGALVALLDRSQSVHLASIEFFSTWKTTVVTTEAVLTESTHLLSNVHRGPVACLDFVLRATVLIPASEKSVRRCRILMEKYADVPMDYADATLVALAEDLHSNTVFTFDRDFRIYRIHGKKQFTIVPTMA